MKKTIRTIMKKFLIAIACLVVIGQAQAQTDNRSITLSVGHLESTWPTWPGQQHLGGSVGGTPQARNLLLSGNLWNLNDRITAGFYVGTGMVGYRADSLIRSTINFRYGLNAKYHFLRESTHWDIAFSVMLGGLYCPGTTLQRDCGAGLSVSWFPFKKFGLTAEYIWGGFKFADYNTSALYESHQLITLGVSYRL